MAKPRITQTAPHDSPGTHFPDAKIPAKLQRDHPIRAAKLRWSRFKSEIFDQYLTISQKRCKRGTCASPRMALKGARWWWLGHVNHLNCGGHQPYFLESGTADRLRRCQRSSPVSVINI